MTALTMKEAERDCSCSMCGKTLRNKTDIVFKWTTLSQTFVLCVYCVSELRAMYEMHRLGATDLTVNV